MIVRGATEGEDGEYSVVQAANHAEFLHRSGVYVQSWGTRCHGHDACGHLGFWTLEIAFGRWKVIATNQPQDHGCGGDGGLRFSKLRQVAMAPTWNGYGSDQIP